MAQKRIGLSVDLDSVQSHLRGYGVVDNSDISSALTVALPRMLEIFARHSAKATFFVTVSEAAPYSATLQALVRAGHEVACHSQTHPVPFQLNDLAAVEREVVKAKCELEKLAQAEVVGFRAPSWYADRELLTQIALAGYGYDASHFPEWLMRIYRRKVSSLSESSAKNAPVKGGSAAIGCVPQRLALGEVSLVEIPVCTAPVFGLPYYHTLQFMLPDICFAMLRSLAMFRAQPTYVFHAADFLGLVEDGIDARLRRHPGMSLSLAEKLRRADREVKRLSRQGAIVPLREVAASVPK